MAKRQQREGGLALANSPAAAFNQATASFLKPFWT
jgi:hypothetical protein